MDSKTKIGTAHSLCFLREPQKCSYINVLIFLNLFPKDFLPQMKKSKVK